MSACQGQRLELSSPMAASKCGEHVRDAHRVYLHSSNEYQEQLYCCAYNGLSYPTNQRVKLDSSCDGRHPRPVYSSCLKKIQFTTATPILHKTCDVVNCS